MSGSNFNSVRNTPYAAENTVFFTDESQLPAPVTGQIPLAANTAYVMYNDDPSTDSKIVTIANELLFPDAGGTMITSTNLGSCILAYTGTGDMFVTSENFTGFASLENLFMTCANGTVYNIDGVLPVGNEFFPRINHNFVGFFNVNALGTIKTVAYNINTSAYFQCNTGLTLDHTVEALITDVRFTEWNNVAGTVMLTFKNSQQTAKISSCVIGPASNETVFDIQPSILVDEQVSITSTTKKGAGATYLTGEPTGSYTAVADVSTSGTVTAAAGTAFGETIFTDVAHGLVQGQFITQSTFSESQYNGTFEVLEIIDVDNYRVHVGFTITDTGAWVSDIIQVTSAAHGLSVDDGVQLTDDDFSKGYDAGYRILATATNTFNVNQVFSATSTGAWSTNSLNQTDPRITVVANSGSGIPDSKAIAFGEMNGNANITAITDGAYTNSDVTGIVQNAISQRFVLTNATTGEFTYTGLEDFEGDIEAVVTVTKTGSTANYRFALSVNGATPVFATTPFSPMEVKTTKVSSTVIQPASLVTDDTIEIMNAGDGTADDITITDFLLNGRR